MQRRFLKGFGKRYFTLAAIQAYASASTLSQEQLAFASNNGRFGSKERESETAEPPPDILPATLLLAVTTATLKAESVHFFKNVSSPPQYLTVKNQFIIHRRYG